MMLQATIDVTGSFTAADRAWESLLGWQTRELLSTPLITRVHPDDIETVIAAIHHLHSGGKQVSFNCRIASKDRTFIWIRWQARVDEGATGINLLGRINEADGHANGNTPETSHRPPA